MLRPLLILLTAGIAVAAEPLAMSAVPAGRLQNRLHQLEPAAQARALRTLGRHPGLLRDHAHLRVLPSGGLVFDNCAIRAAPAVTAVPAPLAAPIVAAANIPLTSLPAFNSRPGSARTLVLDFTGATISGTDWNVANPEFTARSSYRARPFDLDGFESTFSSLEVETIRLICNRVAEDFRPFDINVTTVEPGSYGPLTGHALITNSIDANNHYCPFGDTSGGVAYVNAFGDPDYQTASPAWIYYDQLAESESIIADTISHEFGHNLGLSHDGQTPLIPANEYYEGQGSPYSWGPIMGSPYSAGVASVVTQWSKGEYNLASNTEDDLAIIAADLPVLADDHGDLPATATALSFTAGSGGTRDVAAGIVGTITSANDSDIFRFEALSGPFSLTVTPFAVSSSLVTVATPGSNLDAFAEVLDLNGDPIAGLSSDPQDDPTALISGSLPVAGTYYLRIHGTGNRDPLTTGFSSYASIGSYTVTGNLPTAAGTISFDSASLTQNEGSDTYTIPLTVRRNIDATGATTVDYATANVSALAGIDYDATSGSLSWIAGDTSDRTIIITVHGDLVNEANHSFTVTLSNPSNGNELGAAPVITVTLRNDDAPAGSSSGGGGGGGLGGCNAGAAMSLLLAAGLGLVRRRRR